MVPAAFEKNGILCEWSHGQKLDVYKVWIFINGKKVSPISFVALH